MKKFKKLLAMACCLAMLLPAVPAARAEESGVNEDLMYQPSPAYKNYLGEKDGVHEFEITIPDDRESQPKPLVLANYYATEKISNSIPETSGKTVIATRAGYFYGCNPGTADISYSVFQMGEVPKLKAIVHVTVLAQEDYDALMDSGSTPRDCQGTSGRKHRWYYDWTLPTCERGGNYRRHCSSCREEEILETFGTSGHSFRVTVKKPTQTSDGVRTYICGDCNYKYTETIPALGGGGTINPGNPTNPETGTDPGSGVRPGGTDSCVNGHSWSEARTVVKATCVQEGRSEKTCRVCGETETGAIPKTDHSWENKTEAATAEKEGREYRVCSICSKDETLKVLPKTGIEQLPQGPAVGTETSVVVKSRNRNAQNYSGYHAMTVKSYLYENKKGGLTRVEYTDGKVVIEDYDSNFKYLSGRIIEPELSVWGGFFAGADYNFLIFGQNNSQESDSTEVIRVVKYSKSWQRIGSASLYGANTETPFRAGSLRCDEYGGYLYIRTSHRMYKASDGLNHQANLTMAIRQSDMSIVDDFHGVRNVGVGYVSHSFNQFILVDQENRLVALDHGDAYPRAAVLVRYNQSASAGKVSGQCSNVVIQSFPGAVGQNNTGASLGGLAETSSGYVVAYNYDSAGGTDSRQEYLAYVGKNSQKSVNTRLSTVPGGTPVLAPAGLNGGYVLWSEKNDGSICYVSYNADGSTGASKTAASTLSDCQPIMYQGKATWYVTDNSTPVFYTLNDSGVTAIPIADNSSTTTPTDPTTPTTPTITVDNIPARGTAYASNQTVTVDGRPVQFQMYALKDANGNLTNYIKLRDMAYILNDTQAQFAVGYDGTISLTTGQPYAVGGTEMTTPFSGNRGYRGGAQGVKVNGTTVNMTAITLTDANGGDYNYFKLRDLGKALGFNVGYSNASGVFIETDKPYTE